MMFIHYINIVVATSSISRWWWWFGAPDENRVSNQIKILWWWISIDIDIENGIQLNPMERLSVQNIFFSIFINRSIDYMIFFLFVLFTDSGNTSHFFSTEKKLLIRKVFFLVSRVFFRNFLFNSNIYILIWLVVCE